MLPVLLLMLVQPCPEGMACPRPAPSLASPAHTENGPVKRLVQKERSAVVKRGKSHLPRVAPRIRPFARKSCHRPSHRPFVHGLGPRAWASRRHR